MNEYAIPPSNDAVGLFGGQPFTCRGPWSTIAVMCLLCKTPMHLRDFALHNCQPRKRKGATR